MSEVENPCGSIYRLPCCFASAGLVLKHSNSQESLSIFPSGILGSRTQMSTSLEFRAGAIFFPAFYARRYFYPLILQIHLFYFMQFGTEDSIKSFVEGEICISRNTDLKKTSDLLYTLF